MPRVKLKKHAAYQFNTEMTVRIGDLNYGGHVGHVHLLFMAHEARIRFLQQHGFLEFDCGGVSLIQADTVVNYKGEAFLGDVLVFEVSAGEPFRRGFRMFFHVFNKKTGNTVALIENGLMSFDYKSRKPVNLPAAVLDVCAAV